MSVVIHHGDVREILRSLPDEHFDCAVTSPPYWGLRSYLPSDHPLKPYEIGCEPTLGQHIDVLVDVFNELRRVLKPRAALWLNYGDCYATKPNGRSAAATKAAGKDDPTFRDKPFDTTGPIYGHLDTKYEKTARAGKSQNLGNLGAQSGPRVVGVGMLKPKDLCLIPFRLVIALQESGWWVRSRCVWGKPNPMPDSSGKYRPSVAHEEIFLLSKSGNLYYDADAVSAPCSDSTHARLSQEVEKQIGSERANGGRKTNGKMKAVARKSGTTPRNDGNRWNENNGRGFIPGEGQERRFLRTYEPEVWHIPTAAFSEAHFATFPPALVERCLMSSCPKGGHVIDPFGGSGTVGMVADRMGFNATLIDLNQEYVDLAEKRVRGDSPLFAEVTLA